MRKRTKVLRQSTLFSTPQNYVTIEIRNKNISKKLSHHRSSVLNQLQATESILNNSLVKCMPEVKSAFLKAKPSKFNLKRQMQDSTLSSLLSGKEKKLIQNRRKQDRFQLKYRICEQIKNKLKQITNISHHFDNACMHKPKKLKTEVCQIQQNNYLLPTLEQKSNNLQTDGSVAQLKMNKNWLKKLRNGRSMAQKLISRVSNIKLSQPLKQKIINENRLGCQRELAIIQPKQIQNDSQQRIKKNPSLQDKYFTRQERKTAPISHRTNTFYKMFCSNKESLQTTFRDPIKIECEQVRKLQQFVCGIQPSQFKQYDNFINIKDFLRDRQNFNVLEKIYSHVKNKYELMFKQMNVQTIKQSNLLAVVYYLQNQSNMTQQEKKTWKTKMKLIE